MVNVCRKLPPRPVEEHETKIPRVVRQEDKIYTYVYEDSTFVCAYCGSVSTRSHHGGPNVAISANPKVDFSNFRYASRTARVASTSRRVECCWAKTHPL